MLFSFYFYFRCFTFYIFYIMFYILTVTRLFSIKLSISVIKFYRTFHHHISGMKTSGTKAELLHRIQTGEGNPDEMVKLKTAPATAPKNEYSNEFVIEDTGKYGKKLISMTVAELKQICVEKSLKVSGKKAEIIQRIELHDFLLLPISERIPISKENGDSDSEMKNKNIVADIVVQKIPDKSSSSLFRTYDAMSLEFLQDICRSKSLSHNGDKMQLIETLLSDEVEDGSVSENAFVDFYNEGLRSEVPLLTILQPPAKKYREIR
jgi:SAP domain